MVHDAETCSISTSPHPTPPSLSPPKKTHREPLPSVLFGCLSSETLGPLRCSRTPLVLYRWSVEAAGSTPGAAGPISQVKKKKARARRTLHNLPSVLPLIHFSPSLHFLLSGITVEFFNITVAIVAFAVPGLLSPRGSYKRTLVGWFFGGSDIE